MVRRLQLTACIGAKIDSNTLEKSGKDFSRRGYMKYADGDMAAAALST